MNIIVRKWFISSNFIRLAKLINVCLINSLKNSKYYYKNKTNK